MAVIKAVSSKAGIRITETKRRLKLIALEKEKMSVCGL